MKKLFFLLLLSPLLAHASNWVMVAQGATSGTTFFIDTQSIQRSGNSVTFWKKVNFGTRGQYGDLSAKVNATINCKTREKILRYSMYYDDLDNMGKMTLSGPASANEKWIPISPDSVDDAVMRAVCKLK